MTRIIKVLAVFALIAGYAYVSNQDFEDKQLAQSMTEAAYK